MTAGRTMLDLSEDPHRRYNPLTNEWILVSPHRAKRPWQGKIESFAEAERPAYDPSCYLCPGNLRAGGIRNPQYSSTYVFDNDFSALRPDTPADEYNQKDLLVARGEEGICRVVCFSERHDLTLAEMSVPQISAVVETWREEYRSLGLRESIRYVQIFENKGELMGCSNPHPHGQIWAEKTVPVEPAKEDTQQTTYLQSHGRCLLCDYLALELARGERVVCENPEFVAVVPFWAVWPFETLVLSRTHHVSIDTLETFECRSFAEILKRVSTRYDNLFNISFPYSCGIHQSPTDDDPHPGWHLHVHFYPPLLRSATVRKFMVGYEMLANPQRDITPELSAARLRELSETHFRSPAVAQSR